MTARTVEIAVAGKVIVDADVSKAQEKIKSLERAPATIGSGAAPSLASQPPLIGPSAPPAPMPSPDSLNPNGPSGGGVGGRNHLNGLNAGYFETLATRALASVLPKMQQQLTSAEMRRLGNQIEQAIFNAEQTKNAELIETLKHLQDDLNTKRNEASRNSGGGGAGAPPKPPPGPPLPPGGTPPAGGGLGGVGRWLSGQAGALAQGSLTGVLGGGLGGAAAGFAGRFLGGPVGMALGGAAALNWAFNAASNSVTEGNAIARKEITGYADLARQYGSDSNLQNLFRTDRGWTQEQFGSLGYTAPQAAHVMALYDRPGMSNNLSKATFLDGSDTKNRALSNTGSDLTSMLTFARTMGLDESRVASTTRSLGIAGAFQSGDSESSLRILKQAMLEGVKGGISSSDTLNTMLGLQQRNSERGVSTNNTSLSLMSAIQQRLNSPLFNGGNPLMKGAEGMKTVQGLMDGMGSPTDPGMDYLLLNGLIKKGLPDAKGLGLVDSTGAITSTGIGYETMRSQSPLQAARFVREQATTFKNPAALATLGETMDNAAGGNPAVKLALLQNLNPSISMEKAFGLLGPTSLQDILAPSADELKTAKAGASLKTDVQGGNKIEQETRALDTAMQDREFIKSFSNLMATGGIEQWMASVKNDVSDIRGYLASRFGGTAPTTFGGMVAGGKTYNPGFITDNQTRAAAATAQADAGRAPDTGRGLPGFGVPTRRRDEVATPPGLPALSGTSRSISAVAMQESSNGRNTNHSGNAQGVFGIQAGHIVGKGGWDKQYLGYDAKNADGSQITTTAQARSWMQNNPDEVNKMGVNALSQLDAKVRGAYFKADMKVDDGVVAGMVGMLWHRNGGSSLAPMLDGSGRPKSVSTLSDDGGPDGISDLRQFVSVSKHGRNPNLEAANVTNLPAPSAAPSATGNLQALTGGQKFTFTQGFGANKNNKTYNYGPSGHTGEDMVMKEGAPVRAGVSGTVQLAKASDYGNYATITMKNNWKVILAHLQKFGAAKDGQTVSPDTIIGYQGHTGNVHGKVDGGSHVHVEVRNAKNQPVDPKLVFNKGFSSGGYTGDLAADKEAGVVHGQEFVVNARATAKHRDLLEQLNQGHAHGGEVSVNLGGTLQLNVTLTSDAQAQVQAAYQTFQQQAGKIISRDVKNHRGLR